MTFTRTSNLTPIDSLGSMLDFIGLGRPRDGATTWTPAMDVLETEDGLRVSIELPGMTKDALDVTLENGVLAVSGEKNIDRTTDDPRYHAVERRTGSFRRALTLPKDIDADKADASFENGVLTISIPKSETVKPRQITIK